MTSEVRKVLERERDVWDEYSFYKEIANAERSDAAKREEPVQELRRKVAELVDRWSTHYVPIDAAVMVRRLLAELNAIIATKPDPVEGQYASGPVMHDLTPVTVQQVREIAAEVVRDAMPDVLESLAWTLQENKLIANATAFREHAARLRKERGA